MRDVISLESNDSNISEACSAEVVGTIFAEILDSYFFVRHEYVGTSIFEPLNSRTLILADMVVNTTLKEASLQIYK